MTATPILLAAAWTVLPAPLEGAETPTIIESGFVFEEAPTPSCHASTILETGTGLLAAWFGGTAEKNPDVVIYVARREGGKWSTPARVADGVQDDGQRFPCWNPVLSRP